MTPSCTPGTFIFEGNSALSGTAGNIRTYTVGGVTVNVSGFNRVDSNGAWSTAWLGVYAQGLGVTNFSEGSGSNNQHVVDNIGGNRDYVLFEFSSPIVVTQAFLDYVYNGDSDMSVWIGTKTNPYTSHNTLSDAFLASIAPREDNDTTLTTSRWAVFNAANRSGNVVVISASASDTTPEDTFKIHKLMFGCQGGATPTPTATATATATPVATPSPTASCTPRTFVFEGNSATSGTAGNIRTYTVSGVSVKVSGFNRVDSSGSWSTAYLGVYAHGLGVTNFSEGNGDNDRHVVDSNGGNRDYVLFEFNSTVVVDQAYLDYIVGDSDMSAWIGTKTDPYNNHNTLSDAFLASIPPREDNDGGSSPRWADINAANRSGNVLVISASASDTTPEDGFKIRKLLLSCGGGTPSPTPTASPACPPITVSPSTLPNGKKSHSYSQTLTASGGTSPYTFSKTSGSLPPGLSLSSGGVLSGTPTSSGTYTFTVQAKDSHNCTGTRSYSLRIKGDD